MKKVYFFLSVILLSSCQLFQKNKPVKIEGLTQGSYFAITYFDKQERDFSLQIDSILNLINSTFSIYDSSSMICRFNQNKSPLKLNDHFIQLFSVSQRISKETDGAFDITVGPLVNMWGFGSSAPKKISDVSIDSILHFVGYKKVSMIDSVITKDNPKIRFDFNAIAQGYTVDLLADFFNSKQIENYLIDVGGEVYAKGSKPRHPWKVGIEKPSITKDSERTLQTTVFLKDKALATSGNYRKYYEENGIRYSHTIDPKTGYPVKHTLLSVSVLTDNCTLADAYATAFMVMGLEKATSFIKNNASIEAYFIFSDEKGILDTYATEGFKKLLKE